MYSRVLHHFLNVADAGNITTAAETLNISQPALTKSIQKLESEVGSKLFVRVPKGVKLTKAGEILLHHTRVMDNEYRHANERIAQLSGTELGTLRVGAGPIWLVKLLPPVVASFQKSYPEVRVSLMGGVISTLVPALVSGDLDIICVSLDFPDRTDVVKMPLFTIKYSLIVAPCHPLASEKNVTTEDLHQQRWLVLNGDYATQRISAFFATSGIQQPKISLETTSIYSLLETLRCGEYVAHIPEQLLGLAKDKGLVEVNLQKQLWENKGGLAVRQSVSASSALTGFIDTIKGSIKLSTEDSS